MLALSNGLIGLALFGPLIFGAPVRAGSAQLIEIFNTSERSITGVENERLRSFNITSYSIDGVERFESRLSEGLPADLEAAKTEGLLRIQQLDDACMAPAKNAAFGLAKAVQLGVDRYPAIVFDGQAVVYGVTDLVDAVARYEAWREDQSR